MGALFIASVSVFTSCKDYDDDINGLDNRVSSLESSLKQQIEGLTTLQQHCNEQCDALNGRIATAEETLKAKADAETVNKAIEAAISGAKETAEGLDAEVLKAAKEYTDLVAQRVAEETKAAAVAEAKTQAQELLAEALKGYVTTDAFNKGISDLVDRINGIDKTINTLVDPEGALMSAINANNSAIEQINIQLKALDTFKKEIEGEWPGVKADVKKAKEDLEKLNEDLGKQKEDLEQAIKDAKDDLAQQISDLETKMSSSATVSAVAARVATIESQIVVVRDSLIILKNASATNAEAIETIQNTMLTAESTIIKNLGESVQNINVLTLFLDKFVTSMYLKPDFFYGGIEAIELPALYDDQYSVKDPLIITREGDKVVKMETFTEAANLAKVDVCKGGTAWYHLNPYNAKLDGKVKFISNIATSRAGEADADVTLIEPVNENLKDENVAEDHSFKSKVYSGLVGIDFTGSFEYINALLRAGKLPQVALNYQQTTDEKEINVSSDWALVAPTQYCDLLIADHTGVYKLTPHTGFNFGQAVDAEIATLGEIEFDEYGKEESRVNPTTGHFTRLLENLTADSIPGTYLMKYDSIFCLNDLVETHYTYSYRTSSGVEVTKKDQIMTKELFEKFGLHYEFDIVTYNSGNNDTDESAHIEVAKQEDGTYMAQFVQVNADGTRMKAKGETEYGFQFENAGRASAGRMPVVRVIIKDETGKIVSYSYIKFEITEDEVVLEPETVDFTFNDKFYVDCDEASYKGILTWSQVENQILIEALKNNYSKDSFEDRWTLVGYNDVIAKILKGSEGDADQFSAADEKTKLEKKLGKIQLVEDPKGQHTQVIQWELAAKDIYELFMLKDEKGAVITEPYMRVDPEKVDLATGESKIDIEVYALLDGPTKIWVKFLIPKGTFVFAMGSINDNKTKSYWFDLNSILKEKAANPKHNLKETRANVTVPNTQNDDCAFEWDLLAAFNEYKVLGTLKEGEKYPVFKEGAENNLTFEFTTPAKAGPKYNAEFDADKDGYWTVKGNSGAEYTVRVAPNNDAILAIKKDKDAIAAPNDTIVAFKSVYTKNDADASTLVYYQTDAALDILNYASRPSKEDTKYVESKQTFTADLKITVADCYEMIINDGSDYVNVKFLRPVEVVKTKDAFVEDATDGGSIVNVMDLVDLYDWRFESFKSANGITDNGPKTGTDLVKYEKPHYINYYEVEILADVDKAHTDIHMNNPAVLDLEDVEAIEKLPILKVNNPKADFTFTPAPITYDEKAKKFLGGEIFYANISGNLSTCHIYVPITLNYKWGKNIYCGYALINVKPSHNQGLAKKH
jgi:archaellum component FlaC